MDQPGANEILEELGRVTAEMLQALEALRAPDPLLLSQRDRCLARLSPGTLACLDKVGQQALRRFLELDRRAMAEASLYRARLAGQLAQVRQQARVLQFSEPACGAARSLRVIA